MVINNILMDEDKFKSGASWEYSKGCGRVTHGVTKEEEWPIVVPVRIQSVFGSL